MFKQPEPLKNVRRVKVQRTPAGAVLCAYLMIGADDLSFVDFDTEWLRIKKAKTANGLTIEIWGGE